MAMPRPDESATYVQGHAAGYDPDADLDELFEEFIEDSVSFINGGTEKTYRRDYARLRSWLISNGLPVTAAALERPILARYISYLRQRPNQKPGRLGRAHLSNHSLNTYLRPIRTFARYLVEAGRFPRDPLWGPRSPMPRAGARVSKAANLEDVACLNAGTEGNEPLQLRDRVLFLLGLDNGCRTGEMVRLLVGHVHVDALYVEIHEGKGDKSRVVPISRETAVAIKRYLRLGRPQLTRVPPAAVQADDVLLVGDRGRPMTANGAYQAVDRAYQRGGGVGPMGLHRFRHLFARDAQEAGGDPRVVQDILGHSDQKTTRGYAGMTSLARRQAVHAAVTPLRALLPRSRRGSHASHRGSARG